MLIVCNANRQIKHIQLKREQRYNANTYQDLTVRALHINMRYVWGVTFLFLSVSYMDCIRWINSDTEILGITTRNTFGKMTLLFRVLVTDGNSAATLDEQSISSLKRCTLRDKLWVVNMGSGSERLRIVSSSGFGRHQCWTLEFCNQKFSSLIRWFLWKYVVRMRAGRKCIKIPWSYGFWYQQRCNFDFWYQRNSELASCILGKLAVRMPGE